MIASSKKELVLLTAYAIENNFSDSTIDLLIEATGREHSNEPNSIRAQVRAALFENGMTNRINAIKKHRELTGMALKESKEWVEKTFNV